MAEILLLSRDPQLVSTLQTACAKTAMNLTVCPDAKHASTLLRRRKFYAVLADNIDGAATSEFLGAVRQSTSSKSAVSIVFADTPARGVSDAAMVVTKPVSAELALRTLRAAQGSITSEFRRYLRHPMRTAVTMTFGSRHEVHATSVNLSDGGLEIQLTDPEVITSQTAIRARFVLPVSGDWVQISGDVVWCDPSGRIGVRFRGATPNDSERLRIWLTSQNVSMH